MSHEEDPQNLSYLVKRPPRHLDSQEIGATLVSARAACPIVATATARTPATLLATQPISPGSGQKTASAWHSAPATYSPSSLAQRPGSISLLERKSSRPDPLAP